MLQRRLDGRTDTGPEVCEALADGVEDAGLLMVGVVVVVVVGAVGCC